MAAAFEKEFGLETEFLGGSGGILEITLDGDQVVWTNRDNRGYKPPNEEAIEAMKPFVAG